VYGSEIYSPHPIPSGADKDISENIKTLALRNVTPTANIISEQFSKIIITSELVKETEKMDPVDIDILRLRSKSYTIKKMQKLYPSFKKNKLKKLISLVSGDI
jgi:hypothetical protein